MNIVSITLVQGEDPDASKRPVWITDAVLFCGSPQGAGAVSAGRKEYGQDTKISLEPQQNSDVGCSF